MNELELTAQRELDHDILAFVREMEQHAPVRAESVHGFESVTRRRRVTLSQIRDRLTYLVRAGYLAQETRWAGGEVHEFTITAEGMELLDGATPPRHWKG